MDTDPDRRSQLPRARGALLIAVALVAFTVGLVAVVHANLQTSADIRKESQEAYFLGEMQLAVTTVEESLAAWQLAPNRTVHPAQDPVVEKAATGFKYWAAQLRALIDGEEVAVVEGFESAFNEYMDAVVSIQPGLGQQGLYTVAGLDLAVRAPLLDLLQEENEHLLQSLLADRRSEQLLRWGLPLLLVLTLIVLAIVIRLQNRSRQLDEQRRTNEIRSEFIASISHELRTPLTPVVAYAHELKDRLGDFSDDEVVEFAGTIARESDEVSAIVDDLLVAARIETGQLSIRPEELDICDQIEQAIRTIDAPIQVEASGKVLADGGRLRQILRNLVSNALRYGGDEIKVTAGRVANEVLIVVADSGPGIPAGLEERVFDPFTSVHEDDGLPASVGLGLAVSRNLATLMGGNLSYLRKDGWSRLDLVLPAPADG